MNKIFFKSSTLTFDFGQKWIQSIAPCWCSNQKAARGGGAGGARRGVQNPLGPNEAEGWKKTLGLHGLYKNISAL